MKKIFVSNQKAGLEKAKDLLYQICDQNTLLLLSGGSTPKNLYQNLSEEKKIKVGAVAMIDERYGKPFHKDSNEKMIEETGFIECLNSNSTAFFGFLENADIEKIVKDYENIIKNLFSHHNKKVAIIGIGSDGHTAGIAPNRKDPSDGEASFHNPLFNKEQKDLLVSYFKDPKKIDQGGFGERVTLTFKGLEGIDQFIIIAFGENKKKALEMMFKEGKIEEIPSRFFQRPEISKKTILITDQRI